jgi:hypothetical protein
MTKHEQLSETPTSVRSPKFSSPGVFESSPPLWTSRLRQSNPLERDVTRTVERPAASLGPRVEDQGLFAASKAIAIPGLGRMLFDSSFRRLDHLGLPMWRARARLIGKGARICHHTRVEVELTPWSMTATQLRVTPRSSRVRYWGPRRRRRYFQLAHRAAKLLVEILLPVEVLERPAQVESRNENSVATTLKSCRSDIAS